MELVEEGKANSPESRALLEELLGAYRGKLDAVVLGCTHYPFAAKTISQILEGRAVLLDGGEGTAAQTRRRLEAADLLHEGPGQIIVENSLEDPAMLALSDQLIKEE